MRGHDGHVRGHVGGGMSSSRASRNCISANSISIRTIPPAIYLILSHTWAVQMRSPSWTDNCMQTVALTGCMHCCLCRPRLHRRLAESPTAGCAAHAPALFNQTPMFHAVAVVAVVAVCRREDGTAASTEFANIHMHARVERLSPLRGRGQLRPRGHVFQIPRTS